MSTRFPEPSSKTPHWCQKWDERRPPAREDAERILGEMKEMEKRKLLGDGTSARRGRETEGAIPRIRLPELGDGVPEQAEDWCGESSGGGQSDGPACVAPPPPCLPRFSGDVPWECYAAQLEVVTRFYRWSAPEMAVQLCLALEGEALQVLIDLPTQQHLDPEALKTALRKRFGQTPPSEQQRLAFRARKRRNGERPSVLAVELHTLARQAYPGFQDEVLKELTLEAFLNALFPIQLQRHVRLLAPLTLDDAVREAERAEPILCASFPRSESSGGGQSDGGALGAEFTAGRVGERDGLWFRCEVSGTPIHALIDTGSSVSLIRPGVIKGGARERAAANLRSVTGEVLRLGGVQRLTLRLGQRVVKHEFWLAAIEEECILGLDLLAKVSAKICLGDSTLLIDAHQLPLSRRKADTARVARRRVRAKHRLRREAERAVRSSGGGELKLRSSDARHSVTERALKEPCSHCAAVRPAPATPWTREQLLAEQEADPEVGAVRRWLAGGSRPEWTAVAPVGQVAKALVSQWSLLKEQGGVLYRLWGSPTPGADIMQLVVPLKLRKAVLEMVHGHAGSGHFGVTKTLKRLRQAFYWPGCSHDVELFTRCCPECAAKKGPSERARAPLQSLRSGSPMERVGVDVLGPFPVTERGNKYVLVAVDYFTKWPEAYAVPDQSAETTARSLVEQFFSRFGAPEELHSDQGRNFEAEVMQEVCRLLGVEKTRTTPLHPQSDGLVERFNKTLATQLAMVVEADQGDWDLQLPLVLWACRTAVQESSGFTPARLMLGRELRTPVQLVFGLPPDKEKTVRDEAGYADELFRGLSLTYRIARDNQAGASARQKRAYDMRARGAPLAVGSAVWLFNPKRKKGRCPKLQSDWEGPFSVVKQLSDVVYRVRTGRRFVVVHRDRLAPAETLPGEFGVGETAGQTVSLARPRRPRTRPRHLKDFV